MDKKAGRAGGVDPGCDGDEPSAMALRYLHRRRVVVE